MTVGFYALVYASAVASYRYRESGVSPWVFALRWLWASQFNLGSLPLITLGLPRQIWLWRGPPSHITQLSYTMNQGSPWIASFVQETLSEYLSQANHIQVEDDGASLRFDSLDRFFPAHVQEVCSSLISLKSSSSLTYYVVSVGCGPLRSWRSLAGYRIPDWRRYPWRTIIFKPPWFNPRPTEIIQS